MHSLAHTTLSLHSPPPIWVQKNGPWAWNTSLLRERAHTVCAGLIALCGNIFPCPRLNMWSFALLEWRISDLRHTPGFQDFRLHQGGVGSLCCSLILMFSPATQKTRCSVQECLTSISDDWNRDDLYCLACSRSPTPPDFSNQCTVFCWTDTTLYFKLAKVKIIDNFKYGWWCGWNWNSYTKI